MTSTEKHPLRIIRIQAANIKKLKAIDLTPNRFLNRLSGGNGAGKTSTLDAIEWTLTKATGMDKLPVRKGAVHGKVKLSLSEDGSSVDVTITRNFSETGAKKVREAEIVTAPGKGNLGDLFIGMHGKGKGKNALTPDELQDRLLREISFDPLEFMQMSGPEQYHVLRSISVHDVDLDAIDVKVAQLADAMKPLKNQAKFLQAKVAEVQIPQGLPEAKIDERGLLEQLTEAANYNATIENERLRRKQIENDHERKAQAIADKKRELENLKAEIAALEDAAKQTAITIKAWKPLDEPRDAAAISEEINNARTINRAIDRRNDRDRMQAELDECNEEHKKMDEEMEEHKRRKEEAVNNAQYPIPGLGFGNSEVLYNGLPFKQASTGEQIRVSTAMGMHLNKAVRVMWIRNGALLDEPSLEVVAELAQEHEYQVFIETVDTSGTVGIYFEDGEVKAVNDEPLDKPKAQRAKKGTKK